MTIKAWHFVAKNGRLLDGNTAAAGYVYSVRPEDISMCEWGLHACRRAIDALYYAPGSLVCLVRCGGGVVEDLDKLVCSRREVVAMVDATEALQHFARLCAQDVLHLWDSPAVVRWYLKTGDESIRRAAHDAAQRVVNYTPRGANQFAAYSTAWSTNQYSIQAARFAAKYAAKSIAYSATRFDSTYDVVRATQNSRLERMLRKALNEHA